VIGLDFSGGITKLPLAEAAGALLEVLTGTGEGVAFADAVTVGAGATTAGGLVVCAFTQGINAPSATRILPKEKMQDFIGLREREVSLGIGTRTKETGLLLLKLPERFPLTWTDAVQGIFQR
jgi:hypothetical protein